MRRSDEGYLQMKVIVAGSRNIIDKQIVYDAIKDSGFEITELVSGGAIGVDSIALQWAHMNGVKITMFKPDWALYMKQAGLIRNAQMARHADALIAVWDGKSNGTRHMIEKAEEMGLPIYKVAR